ncbi:MAG: hypothetical protein J0J10_14495 [Bosea sp.]|uniref:hypothetical protein n=1 Tax=Bosea sp. (in: a-proteobacteria) TaxID=1871050 RepID=UPI001AC1160F|nr:hypothetical protein [Bosea sp. (in: a-proteobacteria)]MBN9469972.1 hypothetical protein [Bosea sp. (in: a-proteobacteria)]
MSESAAITLGLAAMEAKTNADLLLASLRAVLPFAESRAEGMDCCADENEGVAMAFPESEEAARTAASARAAADKAIAAVDAAKALLASLDG